jgi:hypothetical protein
LDGKEGTSLKKEVNRVNQPHPELISAEGDTDLLLEEVNRSSFG